MVAASELAHSAIYQQGVAGAAEAQADEGEVDTRWQRPCCGLTSGRCRLACLFCAVPCRWPELLLGVVGLITLVQTVQISVVVFYNAAYPTTRWYRLIFLAVWLAVPVIAGACVIGDVWAAPRLHPEDHWSLSWALDRTKLETAMVSTFVIAFASTLEVSLQLLDLEHERLMVAIGLLALHVAHICMLALDASRLAGGEDRSLALALPSTVRNVLEACMFAEVPETDRAQYACCLICLADFEGDDAVLTLPCRHIFHRECLVRWLQQSQACPLRCESARLRLPSSRPWPALSSSAIGGSRPEEADLHAGEPGQERGWGIAV
uniref:RING-type domain-containing protein n=1 Tax=Alexandrium monilatum TaxID=311494 RepID=A0A7S4V3R6_9DINO